MVLIAFVELKLLLGSTSQDFNCKTNLIGNFKREPEGNCVVIGLSTFKPNLKIEPEDYVNCLSVNESIS
jgi:hypothetical protein